MKRLMLSFLMVIGIIISVSSQTIYPKKILWTGDTVLVINKSQLIIINRSLNDYIHLRKVNTNLQMDLMASDSIGMYWKSIAMKKDTAILFENRKFLAATVYSNGLEQTLKIQKKKSRNRIIGVGVGGTLLGAILMVLFR